ncbi:MAG TPA: RNA methyltransferase [Anaerolineales bacterium]|nr:RNA methyltransferase [Anaerolineales bacterium]
MYNDLMPVNIYEIRVCNACGLRYPLVTGHPFGTRCPACIGETRVVLSRQLLTEPGVTPPLDSNTGDTVGEEKTGGLHRSRNLAVLLDNIRSAWNVGSMLRSADGFGFMHAYLCGITPTPDNGAVTKTSLGAEQTVPWSYHKDAEKLVRGLKKEGWKVYGLEEESRAIDISQAYLFEDFASVTYKSQREVLIVGNEVTGVDPELLDLCDHIFTIPMRGEKKSFNVAIAFGIAAYALTHQTVKRRNQKKRLS